MAGAAEARPHRNLFYGEGANLFYGEGAPTQQKIPVQPTPEF
jgi:hypothetical protein